jgi:hypothetical protein
MSHYSYHLPLLAMWSFIWKPYISILRWFWIKTLWNRSNGDHKATNQRAEWLYTCTLLVVPYLNTEVFQVELCLPFLQCQNLVSSLVPQTTLWIISNTGKLSVRSYESDAFYDEKAKTASCRANTDPRRSCDLYLDQNLNRTDLWVTSFTWAVAFSHTIPLSITVEPR